MSRPDPMSISNFVKKTVRPYLRTGIPFEDLYQTGMLGATIAANKYEESKGSFTTYAAHWIRDELNNFCYRRKVVNGKTKRVLKYRNEVSEELGVKNLVDDEADPFEDTSLESDLRCLHKLLDSNNPRHTQYLREWFETGDVLECAKLFKGGDRSKALKEVSQCRISFIKKAREALENNRTYITDKRNTTSKA